VALVTSRREEDVEHFPVEFLVVLVPATSFQSGLD